MWVHPQYMRGTVGMVGAADNLQAAKPIQKIFEKEY